MQWRTYRNIWQHTHDTMPRGRIKIHEFRVSRFRVDYFVLVDDWAMRI